MKCSNEFPSFLHESAYCITTVEATATKAIDFSVIELRRSDAYSRHNEKGDIDFLLSSWAQSQSGDHNRGRTIITETCVCPRRRGINHSAPGNVSQDLIHFPLMFLMSHLKEVVFIVWMGFCTCCLLWQAKTDNYKWSLCIFINKCIIQKFIILYTNFRPLFITSILLQLSPTKNHSILIVNIFCKHQIH